jgi:phosphate transport system protein
MLKQLIGVWKNQAFMAKVVEEFVQMLRDDEFIFSNAWKLLQGQTQLQDIEQTMHDKDKRVNKQERAIRRKLLEHLSVNPGQDVSGCLVLMSVVKDAERLGDYAKNIFDLSIVLNGHAREMKYFERLTGIQGKIQVHLGQLAEAFGENKEELAKSILDGYAPLKEECSKVLDELINDQLPTQEAVATALLSRFLKRINSHTCNIASGLVYPVDQIDFVRGGILE